MKLLVNDTFPINRLETIRGETINLWGGQGIVHLVLARHTGCIFCNFEMNKYSGKLERVKAAGIAPVFVIQSSAQVVVANQGEAPFSKMLTLVADPKRDIYVAAGVEVSSFIMLKSLWRAFKSDYTSFFCQIKDFVKEVGVAEHKQVPANFLIDSSDGKIIAVHYGKSLYDQWGPDEVVRIKRKYDKEMGLSTSRSNSFI